MTQGVRSSKERERDWERERRGGREKETGRRERLKSHRGLWPRQEKEPLTDADRASGLKASP